jgi:hypothetical protein
VKEPYHDLKPDKLWFVLGKSYQDWYTGWEVNSPGVPGLETDKKLQSGMFSTVFIILLTALP